MTLPFTEAGNRHSHAASVVTGTVMTGCGAGADGIGSCDESKMPRDRRDHPLVTRCACFHANSSDVTR